MILVCANFHEPFEWAEATAIKKNALSLFIENALALIFGPYAILVIENWIFTFLVKFSHKRHAPQNLTHKSLSIPILIQKETAHL